MTVWTSWLHGPTQDLLVTSANSSVVTGDMSMVEPDSGGGGDGIQGGVWN